MKLLALVLLASMIGSTSLSAAVEQCRFINSKPDREACYDRQEKALAAKRKAEPVEDTKTRSVDDVEMKLENDRLSKSLRSICRGC
jgi:cell division protein FtsI/penicillin-binding protein 2